MFATSTRISRCRAARAALPISHAPVTAGTTATGSRAASCPKTPEWIVDLAIAFAAFAAVSSILAVRLGLVERLAKFETEDEFKTASKFKFRVELDARNKHYMGYGDLHYCHPHITAVE